VPHGREDLPVTTDQDVVCFRCGKPAESGRVATGGGALIWATGGPWSRLFAQGERLARRTVRKQAALSGYCCERCRVCWFEY
jgi:hypothetical protein